MFPLQPGCSVTFTTNAISPGVGTATGSNIRLTNVLLFMRTNSDRASVLRTKFLHEYLMDATEVLDAQGNFRLLW